MMPTGLCAWQAYVKLCNTIIETVESVAESAKNPDVVMFENFQHFYGVC